MYFIAGGIILLLLAGWYYRKLLIDQFAKKSAQRESSIHAEINAENKTIDKQAQKKYDKIDKIDPDNLIRDLNRMRDKTKEGK